MQNNVSELYDLSWTRTLIPVEEAMDSNKYILLQRRVIPLLQNLFPSGDDIFWQDLAPCYASKKCKNSFAQSGINVLQRPCYSSDYKTDLKSPVSLYAKTCKRRTLQPNEIFSQIKI